MPNQFIAFAFFLPGLTANLAKAGMGVSLTKFR